MAGNITNIPHFISARSPRGLMSAMLRNNSKDMKQYTYFDISKSGNKWIAWYYREVKVDG